MASAKSTVEWQTWSGMLKRCRPGGHPDYGGRGIRVCPRWTSSFDDFLADMGPRPSKKHSLDRIDVNGNYTPENCRWATREQQARNHRGTVHLTFQGETLTVPEWAERFGMKRCVIYNRLKMGIPIEEVLNPARRKSPWKVRLNHAHEDHGMHRTPEHQAWKAMLGRCTNPRHPAWPDYGGRGIGICEDWRASFLAFLRCVGPRPSPLHSLDRVDNSKGYEPENVRWATRKEQARNNRRNRMLTFQGRTQTLADWSEERHISPETIRSRLRLGWPVEKALKKGSFRKRRGKRSHEKAQVERQQREVFAYIMNLE